jgi:hypothetical protein
VKTAEEHRPTPDQKIIVLERSEVAGQRSYRETSEILATKGHLNVNGRNYDPSSIRSMVAQGGQKRLG